MEKLYKIGEVADMCDTTIKTIRYYEKSNLITPKKTDSNTGYRYFDIETIFFIQQIQKLKSFGFSLSEIKSFINLDASEKINFITKKEIELKKTKDNLYKLLSQTVRNVNHFFLNDKKAIGKWKCIAIAENNSCYYDGKLINQKPLSEYIYFLKNGKGYGLINGWSKGEIYFRLSNEKWTYTIKDNLMFVQTSNNVHIYEKVDSLEREEPNQDYTDNTSLPFETDPTAIGLWTIFDHVHKSNEDKYVPSRKSNDKYFIESITFLPNGYCIIDENELYHKKWTKGFILSNKDKIAMPYKIINHNNKQFLILLWKDEFYKYFGQTSWCYVFEKQ